MANPVEAIIGLGLEVKGRAWDDLHARLDKHKSDWNTVEGSVQRIGDHVETLSSRLLALGGAVGVGALIADFARLEDQANRTALAIGSVTGGSDGFLPIGQQLLGASKTTGFAATTLGQAIEQLQTRAGGTYLSHPGGVQGIARALGMFSGAFNIAPQTLAGQVGTLELFQRQNPGSTPLLLQQLAAQAAASGMAGQTGLFTQVVSGSVGALIGQHPASAGPGANLRLGAMYGAAQSVNPAFRDPSVFGQAIQGIDQSVTNAYTNPRLQAMMQMAGIGYWEQRGGLAGPNGPAIARKILAWSAAQYGDGTIAQDMFLRSNFGGNVSADFLKALAAGRHKQDQIGHAGTSPHALGQAQGSIGQRAHQYQQTPGAAIQRGRSGIEQEVFGLFGQGGLDVLNFVAGHPLESIAGAYAGKKLLGFGGRALGRSLGGRFAGREAASAEELAARMAGNEARAGRFGLMAGANLFDIPIFGGALGRAARGGATAAEIGSHANLLPRGADAAGALSKFARVLPYAGPAGDLAAFLLDDGSGLDSLPGIGGLNALIDPMGHGGLADTTYQDSPRGQRNAKRRDRGRILGAIASNVQRKYGRAWWTNPKAIADAMGQVDRHFPDPHDRLIARKQLRDALAKQASHVAQVGREGASGSAIHDLLGLIPGVGSALGGLFGMGAQALEKHGIDGGAGMLELFGRALHKGSHPTHGAPHPAAASSRQFDGAVHRFSKSVDQLIKVLGAGFGIGGAAYHGSPAGAGMLNAAGLSGGTDLIGSSMILARAISAGGGGAASGGSGGGGLAGFQYAGLGVQGSPGGGSGGSGGGGSGGGGVGGPSHVGGGGWKACTLTWYDPGLGGINSSHGQKDPHAATASGEPYDRNKYTCAADASFPFGTLVAIRAHGRQVTVKVNDRGGAVHGTHFDLSVAARNALGNATSGSYKIVGRAGSGHHAPGTRAAKAGGAAGMRTAKAAAAGGGSDPVAAALAWQAGGSPAGGGAAGGAGGGGTNVTVNVDGRKIDAYKQLTRGRV